MPSTPYTSLRACQECNRKKTKCDMQRPVCGLCHRTKVACTFPLRKKAIATKTHAGISKAQNTDGSLSRLWNLISTNPPALKELARFIRASESSEGLEPVSSPQPNAGIETTEPQETRKSILRPSGDALSTSSTLQESLSASYRPPANPKPALCSLLDGQLFIPRRSVPLRVSRSLAINLIDLFFDKIQPWMPLLHKPTFRHEYISKLTTDSSNCLQNLRDDEALLLHSIFAMSARFSTTSDSLEGLPALHQGDQFGIEALRLCGNAHGMFTPTLTYLQGCIVLAFYFYTAGLSTQGWMLAGTCSRLAYELELSSLDEQEHDPLSTAEWIQKEKLRRAWWLVWELDTFGSIVTRRPYAVDRRRMSVNLPVSDSVWFAGVPVKSANLLTCPGQAWKSLQNCPNQDERAWFLIANHLMSVVVDSTMQKPCISTDKKLAIENDLSCLKLALPVSFHNSDQPLFFDTSTFAKDNWILGTQLMLSATSFRAGSIQVRDSDSVPSTKGNTTALLRVRSLELCQIARRWAREYIVLAHPFFACSLLPVYMKSTQKSSLSSLLESYEDLIVLILSRYAEKWKLGSLMHGQSITFHSIPIPYPGHTQKITRSTTFQALQN